jgi:hypothetical protein
LPRLAKFCVTPVVSSRLITACHQPPGTKMVSPGSWMHSTRRASGYAARISAGCRRSS